jgi:lipopolysaccharide transport system permease protein
MEKQRIDNRTQPWPEFVASLWRYRPLMWALSKRELKIRYSQTWLGMFWALFQPLLMLLVFTVFFEGILKVETQNVPYPVYTFAGVILWYYFMNMVNQASSAVLHSENLIRKIYFPKFVLLLSKVVVSSLDFGISFILLLLLSLLYGYLPPWTALFAPFIALLLVVSALALASLTSALSVKRRDLLHVIPTALNFAIWLTPVFYPASLLPQPYFDWLHLLNPVATIIEFFRWSMLGTPMVWMHCLSFLWIAVLFALGLYLFRKAEHKIADYV